MILTSLIGSSFSFFSLFYTLRMLNQLDWLVASKEEKTDHHHHLVGSGCSIDQISEASINLPNIQMATLECKKLFFCRLDFRTQRLSIVPLSHVKLRKNVRMHTWCHDVSHTHTHRDSIKVWPILHCPFSRWPHLSDKFLSLSLFFSVHHHDDDDDEVGRCVTHHLRSLSHASVKSAEPPFVPSLSLSLFFLYNFRSMFDPWWSFFSRSINLFIQI